MIYGPLLAVAREDSSLSVVVETHFTGLDGLTVDNDGCTYFSSWYTDRVYRYDEAFTHPPEVVSMGHTNPADIFFNRQDNILAIPNFHANRVDLLPIAQQSVLEEELAPLASDLTCRPNPFRCATTISFASQLLDEEAEISIFDAAGRRVRRITDLTGRASVRWDGCGDTGEPVGAGIYYVTLKTGGSSTSRAVILTD